MFAIIELLGKQFNVKKGDIILAPKMNKEEGENVKNKSILFIKDQDVCSAEKNIVNDYEVDMTVVENVKGNKVEIFKKKRRKNFQKHQGHRQKYTKLLISDIKKIIKN